MLRYYISAALYLLSARTLSLCFSLSLLIAIKAGPGYHREHAHCPSWMPLPLFFFARVSSMCVYVDIVVQKINGNEELS